MQPVGYIDGMSERVGRQQSDGEKQCRFCRPNGRNGGARQSDGCRAYGGDNGSDNGSDNGRDGDCGVRCRYGYQGTGTVCLCRENHDESHSRRGPYDSPNGERGKEPH